MNGSFQCSHECRIFVRRYVSEVGVDNFFKAKPKGINELEDSYEIKELSLMNSSRSLITAAGNVSISWRLPQYVGHAEKLPKKLIETRLATIALLIVNLGGPLCDRWRILEGAVKYVLIL